ncbi:hypothetical protein BLA24_22930 [Streptomyces cinnamoneus]|uniref:Protein kinase domain-containing protein n=1 Tax=Streptomyces cinnamoneus TaxID=53446 RepID=A0A2G1XCH9_STRCJ|nr:serine/threonine-protein kinase [Streptomyces cinnamoneus]PHQ48964.1 hypothetical protein BLA24_22930 [Streptomyces cinnamoneus]PPT15391.1 hypothetical protein CYQ11_23145 [Streptomyces cinnamoneus]
MKPLSTGDPLRLGPYRLIGVLGAGGMGKVYLGRDAAGRTAAVKVLLPELAQDRNLSQRFVREAQVAQAVDTPGVARVLGAWTEGGRPWMATEFLAGPTLEEAVERHGPLDDAGLRTLGAELAATLRDVHARGLVHRDIKPSNIVLTSRGSRVIDFGIARPEHGLTLTSTGHAPVTPGYGAPEQALGRRVGPPGDVFSLGAVLAYAASGRRAYAGTNVAAVQYRVVHGEPDLDALSAPVRALVEPCLAKDPADRPLPAQIIAAMAPPKGAERVWRRGALAADIARRETEARRLATLPATTAPLGASSPPSRRGFVTALARGGGVALVAGGVGAAWWTWRSRKGKGPGRPLEAEGTPRPQPWDAERLPSSRYQDGTAPRPLWGPVDGPSGLPIAPLPLGDVVVTHSARGPVALSVTDGQVKWQGKSDSFTALTPVGDELLVSATLVGKLVAFETSTGAERWSLDLTARGTVAADADTVYFAAGEAGQAAHGDITKLCALDVSSRTVRWSVPLPVPMTLVSPAIGAVGDGRLVVCGTDGKVVCLDARTGKEAWRLSQRPDSTDAMAPLVVDGVVYLGGKTLTARRLKDGGEVWSVRAKSPLTEHFGGWGPPTVDGDALYAMDGARLSRRNRHDGTPDWEYVPKDAAGVAPLTAPVVQGKSVWVVPSLSGGEGVTAHHKDSGKPTWTYGRGAGASALWRLAGAGNRVFVVCEKTLVALPVF